MNNYWLYGWCHNNLPSLQGWHHRLYRVNITDSTGLTSQTFSIFHWIMSYHHVYNASIVACLYHKYNLYTLLYTRIINDLYTRIINHECYDIAALWVISNKGAIYLFIITTIIINVLYILHNINNNTYLYSPFLWSNLT